MEGEESTWPNGWKSRPDWFPSRPSRTGSCEGTLAAAVRNLPEVQAEVVSRYYVDGELLQDIAADMGLTEARVSQIRTEALVALRAYFSTQYEGVEPGRRRSGQAGTHRVPRADGSTADWRSRVDSASFLDAASRDLPAVRRASHPPARHLPPSDSPANG
jgi:hypothetical protein